MLEDSANDAELIERYITKAGIHYTVLRVDSREEFVDAIRFFEPDIVLSDHSLRFFNSDEALKIYKDHLSLKHRAAPFILVTGARFEEIGVKMLTNGADDFVSKDKMERLSPVIFAALAKCNIANQFYELNNEKLLLLERYERLLKNMQVMVWDWDIVNNSLFLGEGFETVFGHTLALHSDKNNLHTGYIRIEDIERVTTGIQYALDSGSNNWNDSYKYLTASGAYVYIKDAAVIIRNEEGKAIRMLGGMQETS